MDIDFWLIQKMKHGDENAFDAFVHRYYGEILKILRLSLFRCILRKRFNTRNVFALF